eukprot:GHVT01044057.1.p1 GENE.GHVT01044057.1~~GHVT01044057.1.p1  ORF type:complete len:201 (+),score=12.31 GHVT01044057.1:392-994(+)
MPLALPILRASSKKTHTGLHAMDLMRYFKTLKIILPKMKNDTTFVVWNKFREHPIIKRDFKYIKGLLKLHEEKDDLRKIIEAKNPIERRRGKQRIAKDWAAPVQEQIWKMLKDTNMRDYTLITPCQYAHYMNSEENLPTLTETFLKDLTPIAQKMYNALPEVAVKAWKLYAEGKHKAKFKEALNGLEIRKRLPSCPGTVP